MSRLSSNERGFIDKEIDSSTHNVLIGKVQEVFEHTSTDDASNFEVDVKILGRDLQHRTIPYEQSSSREVKVPRKGDKVMVEYRGGGANPPIARDAIYTSRDHPTTASSGMHRTVFESDTSPVGDGNVYVTGYTEYDENPAITDKNTISPVRSRYQIAKHESGEPGIVEDPALAIELLDSPISEDDSSIARMVANQVNQDSSKSMTVELDAKEGLLRVRGTNQGDPYELEIDVESKSAKVSGLGSSGNEMGISLDFGGNSFKLVDGNGYGIESDGQGNFTWHHQDVDFSEGTTMDL